MPITTPKVPDGLPELMRGLAKSVIKENPENIYVHAAEYFENLIRERDGALDRGYQNFSAYKVYSDYKEKCRGKGGGNESLSGGEVPSSAGGVAVRSRMASDGDDDSGGSASATRGRRKKRVRKQGSKDSNKSLERQESIGPTTENGGEDEKKPTSADVSLQESLNPIKEDTPDIEEAVVKVQAHLDSQAPRERPFNKSVSVDSVAATSAVNNVLQDAVEETDDADRETGEAIETQVETDLAAELGHPINCEDVSSYPPDSTEDDPVAGIGEDYGSAPSTAEVGGEVIGEADVLVNDAPPNESDKVVIIESPQKNLDEVDLSVGKVEENNEEPLVNGSVEENVDSATEASVEKQSSVDAQIEGIDTVDEPISVVEEVEEPVPNLPDVPTEEPNVEEVESGDAEELQAEPIVDEPNEQEPADDETREHILEDANVIKSSLESSADKVDEICAADEATYNGKVESDACVEGVEAQESLLNKTDSVEEVSPEEPKENGSTAPPLIKSESQDNETVAAESSLRQSRSIEDDTNAPPNGEALVDKSGEEAAEKSPPISAEDTENEQEFHGQLDENDQTDNQTQSAQIDQSTGQLENVNGKESGGSVDNLPENEQSVDNVVEEAEASKAENPKASVKSESAEQNDAQSAGEDIPADSPENVESAEAPGSGAMVQPEDGVQENSTGSDVEQGKPSKQPSLDKTESEKGGSPDGPKSSGSAEASKAPSMDKIDSEKEGSADEPKSCGSAKASKEPSLDKPESEKNGILEESKSGGSAKASREPSLDNLESGKEGSADEPKSNGSDKASEEPPLDKPESEKNVSINEPESGDSANASKNPSLDKSESKENGRADEPKSSGSAKASREPSQDNPESEKNENVDEPKSSGSAKSSKQPSLDKPDSEKGESVEDPKSSGSAKVSNEPSVEQADPEQNSDDIAKSTSLDKTESELDQSNDDQSKESSAKESAGESGSVEVAIGPDGGGTADAGELSLSSRMGDDEQEAESEAVDEPSAPPMEEQEEMNETGEEEKVKSDESKAEDDPSKNDGNGDKANTNQVDQLEDEETDESKEEVVEEPCIQRQVSPSASKIPSKQPSVELDDIKKVDLASFNKDSAEALFYTLKKSELANQESQVTGTEAKVKNSLEENDDDDDVVVTEEPPSRVCRESTKRSFTDNFLENSPITDEVSKPAEGDGVTDQDGVNAEENQQFNPMFAANVRNRQLQDQLHSRFSQDDMSRLDNSARKAMMHRSMTERVDLARQDTNFVDLRKYDPDYVEEEDQFDGYYIGNLKHKILASSVSVADSDYYDQEQVEGSIDDINIKTALETVASTDTESTLPSQTTIQANRGFLKRGSQNTSSNIPYASFGNNAINQSLDEFIEREEQMKEAEAQAASTIQRSYRRFRTNKTKLLRDYHSTMQTFTEDQSTESLEDYPSSVIQIKLDRKQREENENSLEDARSENRRRPMYSLNIDEYDTATRRMTLTRGVAMQRNSTPEEDSGKSDNTSGEKKSASEPASNLAIAEGSPRTSSDLSSEEKKSSTSSDEKENKDNSSSKSNGGGKHSAESASALNERRKSASMDVQKLFIARQRTMPVQIETTVMRAQPKHLRKRIKSAGMIRK